MPFTVTMPKLSPTMEEGQIVKWQKKEGEYAEAGDVLLEISTDKAVVEHAALDAGWLRKILVAEGESAKINQPIAIFSEHEHESIVSDASPSPTKIDTTEQPPSAQAGMEKEERAAIKERVVDAPKRILASPLAKRIAKDRGLDLGQIVGTGPGGRIMQKDLPSIPRTTSAAAVQQDATLGAFKEVPLTPMRKVIAARLQETKSTIPHFYIQRTIDAEPLVQLRQQLKNGGVAVTYNDLVLKAVAITLKEHPAVNSGFQAESFMIHEYKTVDISVAVGVEGGVMTPIVRMADKKTVLEISEEVKILSKKAKEGKLHLHEYQGGSFSVSNLGMYGVTNFQAILNSPQSAILAVSCISDVAVVKKGAIVPGKQMSLTLSVDHRVVDGIVAAKFVETLSHKLESPAILLL